MPDTMLDTIISDTNTRAALLGTIQQNYRDALAAITLVHATPCLHPRARQPAVETLLREQLAYYSRPLAHLLSLDVLRRAAAEARAILDEANGNLALVRRLQEQHAIMSN